MVNEGNSWPRGLDAQQAWSSFSLCWVDFMLCCDHLKWICLMGGWLLNSTGFRGFNVTVSLLWGGSWAPPRSSSLCKGSGVRRGKARVELGVQPFWASACHLLKSTGGMELFWDFTDKIHLKHLALCQALSKRLRNASCTPVVILDFQSHVIKPPSYCGEGNGSWCASLF
jgi:hypothetical protein